MDDTANTGEHSSADEVTRALFALNDGDHPFSVAREGERIVATWGRRAGSGADAISLSGNVWWKYRITLLGETGEYRRSVATMNWEDGGRGAYVFKSWDISGPVNKVLEDHGWTKRRTWLGRLLRGGRGA